jgi:hypothetical protein
MHAAYRRRRRVAQLSPAQPSPAWLNSDTPIPAQSNLAQPSQIGAALPSAAQSSREKNMAVKKHGREKTWP